MKIDFNEADHSYRLDGQPVPGVSEIIEASYDFRFVSQEALEASRDLGKKVHKTIELHEGGRLNRATLDPLLDGYLVQWERFKADMGYLPEASEVLVASKRFMYCGTLDSHGLWLSGFVSNVAEERAALVDIKTGAEYPGHRLQTAGYKLAATEMGILPDSTLRASVYLEPDSYTVRFYDHYADEAAFTGLAMYANWKRRFA